MIQRCLAALRRYSLVSKVGASGVLAVVTAGLDVDDIAHAGGHDGLTTEDVLRRVEQEARDAARQAVVRLRDENVIGQEALRRIQLDLYALRRTGSAVG